MDLGEAAVGCEDQNAFRRLAERKRLLAVGRRDLGDHEIPAADDLVLEARRRLRGGGASREGKREHGGGDGSGIHGRYPPPGICWSVGYPGTHRRAMLLRMRARPIAYDGIEPCVAVVVVSHKLSAGRPCERRAP